MTKNRVVSGLIKNILNNFKSKLSSFIWVDSPGGGVCQITKDQNNRTGGAEFNNFVANRISTEKSLSQKRPD